MEVSATLTVRINHKRILRQSEPEKVFVTDITYLPIVSGANVYLLCVQDVATREIV